MARQKQLTAINVERSGVVARLRNLGRNSWADSLDITISKQNFTSAEAGIAAIYANAVASENWDTEEWKGWLRLARKDVRDARATSMEARFGPDWAHEYRDIMHDGSQSDRDRLVTIHSQLLGIAVFATALDMAG